MFKRDRTTSLNIINYSTFNKGYKWEDQRIQLRSQQMFAFNNYKTNQGGSNIQSFFLFLFLISFL